MTKTSKKDLPSDYAIHEGLSELFAGDADMSAPYPSKTNLHQVIADTFKAHADPAPENPVASAAQSRPQSHPQSQHKSQHQTSPQTAGIATEPASPPATSRKIAAEDLSWEQNTPSADEALFFFFNNLIREQYSVPSLTRGAPSGTNEQPILYPVRYDNGSIEMILMPFPKSAEYLPGHLDEDRHDPDMHERFVDLFDDLSAAADKNHVKLIRDEKELQFIIKCNSTLDLAHLLEDMLHDRDIHFRENLDLSARLRGDEASADGAPYFRAPQQLVDYIKERGFMDRANGEELYAKHPGYFLDGLPPHIYVDFAEAARVRYNHHLMEPLYAMIDMSHARLTDALWRAQRKNPNAESGIDPLLRLH